MKKLSFYSNGKIVYVNVEQTKNKNMYLKIKNEEIWVLVPPFTSQKTVNKFVAKHIELFDKYLQNKNSNLLFSLKDQMLYVDGVKYRYNVLTGFQNHGIKISGSKLYINVLLGEEDEVKETIKNYLKHELDSYLKKNLKKWEVKMETKHHEYKVSYKTSTWGENFVTKNKLKFSSRLSHYSSKIKDYVIVHELAHDFEANHSSDFWKIVEKFLPNYKELRNELKADQAMTEN